MTYLGFLGYAVNKIWNTPDTETPELWIPSPLWLAVDDNGISYVSYSLDPPIITPGITYGKRMVTLDRPTLPEVHRGKVYPIINGEVSTCQ